MAKDEQLAREIGRKISVKLDALASLAASMTRSMARLSDAATHSKLDMLSACGEVQGQGLRIDLLIAEIKTLESVLEWVE